METEHTQSFEHILAHLPIGVTLLDASTLRICYVNHYLCSLLGPQWTTTNLRNMHIEDVLSAKLSTLIMPILHEIATTQQRVHYPEVSFEGFLEARGRTYWRVTIEPYSDTSVTSGLLVHLEDITESVRSRLHIQATYSITSALAGPSSLHLVLDRILQVLQEMFGSKRCAIFLFESEPSVALLAAQQGLHSNSSDWHPLIDERLLLYRVMRAQHTQIIENTQLTPELSLPYIEYKGNPCRPGSILSVPIFEPHTTTVFGVIEVYHRRSRGFPAEEVTLLEQFSQQVGLAIQNARLFRSIDRLARVASRNARQKENVMQAIPDGVVICDPRWRVADMNQAARLLLGWHDEILGLPIHEALAQSPAIFPIDFTKTPDLSTQLEQRALQGLSDEIKLRAADGQKYTIQCTYTPIRDELGDTFAFIIVYHDITQQVAARERIEAEVVARTADLQILLERMKTLERAREDFFTTMAHELKTPLANIRAHLSAVLARDLTWSSEEQYDFVRTADEQVERIVDMINKFLDASRVEAGALRLELEPLIIPELIEDLQDRLAALFHSSNCQLSLQIPETLPVVQGDYELIISVLTNLLSNACRYTSEGDTVILQTSISPDGQAVTFSVIDHGPGIPLEHQTALFTRFSTFAALNRPSIDSPGQPEITRRRQSERRSHATGLGLYISRGIIEAHGSQLTLHSIPGQGATFAFTLPVFREKRRLASNDAVR